MIVFVMLHLAYVIARRLVGGLVLLARSDAAKEVEILAASPTRRAATPDPATAADVDRPGGDGGAGAAVAARPVGLENPGWGCGLGFP
jgi:hypothetical protein